MRRLFIGMSVFVIIVALASTQVMGQQRTGDRSSQMGGPQSQEQASMGDQILGKHVKNQQGQDFGRVFALAARNDQIVYILMAKSGSTGELTPIPFTAAHFDPQMDAVVLSKMADSEFSQAPTLSIDDLQKLDDPEFERQVHSYYGQQP